MWIRGLRLRAEPLQLADDLRQLFHVLVATAQDDHVQIGQRLDLQVTESRHVRHDRSQFVGRHCGGTAHRPRRRWLLQVTDQPHRAGGRHVDVDWTGHSRSDRAGASRESTAVRVDRLLQLVRRRPLDMQRAVFWPGRLPASSAPPVRRTALPATPVRGPAPLGRDRRRTRAHVAVRPARRRHPCRSAEPRAADDRTGQSAAAPSPRHPRPGG